MAGLYIHIPFCRSRCSYCDFYSTTREAEAAHYVRALCREIEERREELPHARVRTIYIGGGTPSLLPPAQLQQILDAVYANYEVEEGAEVTMEMNPDDLDPPPAPPVMEGSRLREVNRVSLGIQTFDDQLLHLIRRRHDSATALHAVRSLQDAGIRKGTALTRWRDEGRIREASDELSVAMYQRLCQRAREAGFEHYEISNFALPGFRSRHNSSYWTGIPYLGFGPGAHSYDGLLTRRANLPSLDRYLSFYSSPRGGQEGALPFSYETLTTTDLHNEAVMCGLRTREGIDLARFLARFGQSRLDALLAAAAPHLRAGRLILDHFSLPHGGVSDDIMSDLMAS